MNANNYKINEIEKELNAIEMRSVKDASDDVDIAMSQLEAIVRQNITDLSLVVNDQIMSSIDTKAAADQSKATAELLYNTMLDSFKQIDSQRDSQRELMLKKNKELELMINKVERNLVRNLTHLATTSKPDFTPQADVAALFDGLDECDKQIDAIAARVASVELRQSADRERDRDGGSAHNAESIRAIELRLQPALRQINENKAKLLSYEPMRNSNHEMNQDLFQKLGSITGGLADIDAKVQVNTFFSIFFLTFYTF